MFVFDMQNDLPDNPYINMDSGYLDCKLVPDPSTGRLLTHRPGYAIVFADALDHHGQPHPLAPRGLLASQIAKCEEAGLAPVVATELEFYLCTPDLEPIQSHIQYSSLTDGTDVEACLAEMRSALAGAGLEVESSNAEYGPGQFEINIGHADAMTCADNTVLFKSIVKQIANSYGLVATFMPKPWTEQSGSGQHIHTSMRADGANAFADSNGSPNDLMAKWVAGLLAHAEAMTLLGAPTLNGPKRIRPYTFAPTHIHWGLDNRSVLCRCICEANSAANRVEFRSAGADANPYLMIAAILAAGFDGVQRNLELGPMSEGDMYSNPGECVALPATLEDAVARFSGSALADMLGEMFAVSYAGIAQHEIALAAENSSDPDDVNDWERERFAEHS
jgi:glutamine synthetase